MVGFMKSALNLFGLKKSAGTEGSVDLESFLSDLPGLMGYDVNFKKLDKEEPGIHFEVDGPEMESFLGENCEMLDAISHLSMRVVRRTEGLSNAPATEGENVMRVTFDAAGFRDKKAQELKELATAQRQKVIDSGGKPSYIKALGPSERKIIHTTLADLGEVTSESIGRGNFKRIRVKLKDDSQFRREPEPRAEGAPIEGGEMRAERSHVGGGGGGGARGGRGRGPGGGGQGGGQGGGRGGRGRRGGGGQGGGGRNFGGGQGGGGGRGPRGPRGADGEVNGNVALPPAPVEDENYSSPDDNIGNRLKPGEQPLYRYNSNDGNS